ncbi:hypothetical protein CLIB1444_04S07976 [[Candida] jaroonii]|uniref:Uncharacterized protein n=1 Tax=[Candida] jaroonii TaxID=467808 RepID=A0ACA9Y7X6_9ASCO|nr:hypothetical protein CLIB1444_04S07976 [[Candida] jaroonii]
MYFSRKIFTFTSHGNTSPSTVSPSICESLGGISPPIPTISISEPTYDSLAEFFDNLPTVESSFGSDRCPTGHNCHPKSRAEDNYSFSGNGWPLGENIQSQVQSGISSTESVEVRPWWKSPTPDFVPKSKRLKSGPFYKRSKVVYVQKCSRYDQYRYRIKTMAKAKFKSGFIKIFGEYERPIQCGPLPRVEYDTVSTYISHGTIYIYGKPPKDFVPEPADEFPYQPDDKPFPNPSTIKSSFVYPYDEPHPTLTSEVANSECSGVLTPVHYSFGDSYYEEKSSSADFYPTESTVEPNYPSFAKISHETSDLYSDGGVFQRIIDFPQVIDHYESLSSSFYSDVDVSTATSHPLRTVNELDNLSHEIVLVENGLQLSLPSKIHDALYMQSKDSIASPNYCDFSTNHHNISNGIKGHLNCEGDGVGPDSAAHVQKRLVSSQTSLSKPFEDLRTTHVFNEAVDCTEIFEELRGNPRFFQIFKRDGSFKDLQKRGREKFLKFVSQHKSIKFPIGAHSKPREDIVAKSEHSSKRIIKNETLRGLPPSQTVSRSTKLSKRNLIRFVRSKWKPVPLCESGDLFDTPDLSIVTRVGDREPYSEIKHSPSISSVVPNSYFDSLVSLENSNSQSLRGHLGVELYSSPSYSENRPPSSRGHEPVSIPIEDYCSDYSTIQPLRIIKNQVAQRDTRFKLTEILKPQPAPPLQFKSNNPYQNKSSSKSIFTQGSTSQEHENYASKEDKTIPLNICKQHDSKYQTTASTPPIPHSSEVERLQTLNLPVSKDSDNPQFTRSTDQITSYPEGRFTIQETDSCMSFKSLNINNNKEIKISSLGSMFIVEGKSLEDSKMTNIKSIKPEFTINLEKRAGRRRQLKDMKSRMTIKKRMMKKTFKEGFSFRHLFPEDFSYCQSNIGIINLNLKYFPFRARYRLKKVFLEYLLGHYPIQAVFQSSIGENWKQVRHTFQLFALKVRVEILYLLHEFRNHELDFEVPIWWYELKDAIRKTVAFKPQHHGHIGPRSITYQSSSRKNFQQRMLQFLEQKPDILEQLTDIYFQKDAIKLMELRSLGISVDSFYARACLNIAELTPPEVAKRFSDHFHPRDFDPNYIRYYRDLNELLEKSRNANFDLADQRHHNKTFNSTYGNARYNASNIHKNSTHRFVRESRFHNLHEHYPYLDAHIHPRVFEVHTNDSKRIRNSLNNTRGNIEETSLPMKPCIHGLINCSACRASMISGSDTLEHGSYFHQFNSIPTLATRICDFSNNSLSDDNGAPRIKLNFFNFADTMGPSSSNNHSIHSSVENSKHTFETTIRPLEESCINGLKSSAIPPQEKTFRINFDKRMSDYRST